MRLAVVSGWLKAGKFNLEQSSLEENIKLWHNKT